eukprot:TRINITY_DN18379_c0_g1_i1.p1 TRINITY_DN18379_c0_g1~~TRINITY_DN18379_c0_g1_i1.p1  ORF type:complete len:288 (+),score=40.36 TRINITY_DN18379_c0_g1_i1:333-1196(+)
MPPSKLDLFSEQAALYAKFRPTYPQALFDFLAAVTPTHDLVWDVGTGNGQAAVELAKHFKQVVATDLSAAQISHAQQRDNVRYALTGAVMSEQEVTDIIGAEGSVSLVTVGQALHWFDFDNFYRNVKKVLRPNGVIAAWCYGLCFITPELDAILSAFYVASHPYWEPQRSYIDEEYRTIPFDFVPIQIPQGTTEGKQELAPEVRAQIEALQQAGTGPVCFDSIMKCTMAQFIGYLSSWSAVQTARERGVNLTDSAFEEKVARAWGDPQTVRSLRFPVFLRIGQVGLL